eukprot:1035017-Prymnesium_polylepis.1
MKPRHVQSTRTPSSLEHALVMHVDGWLEHSAESGSCSEVAAQLSQHLGVTPEAQWQQGVRESALRVATRAYPAPQRVSEYPWRSFGILSPQPSRLGSEKRRSLEARPVAVAAPNSAPWPPARQPRRRLVRDHLAGPVSHETPVGQCPLTPKALDAT